MTQDLEKLRQAAQSFSDGNDKRMLVKLIRKYPEAARLPLKDGASLMVRALENIKNDWPLLVAYVQGGGLLDGTSPTRGGSSVGWLDILLQGAEASGHGAIVMAMTLLHESGCTGEVELKKGRCLANAFDLDMRAGVHPMEGAFALAMEMKCPAGVNDLDPVFMASRDFWKAAPECEALLRAMKDYGIPIDSENDVGLKPIHYAIARKNTDFIIGLSRNGVYLGDHIKAIRECGFSSEELAHLEAEWMDAEIGIENSKGSCDAEGKPAPARSMIPRKGV